jgi:tryptophan-rich sensory protein
MDKPARLQLLLCLALPTAVGVLSGFATSRGVRTWYPTLEKPGFTPPDWLFGPVWTLLYLLMGLGLWLVWRSSAGPRRRLALWIFGVQLALNAAWSFLFFGFQRIGTALIEIGILWAFILAMVVAFRIIRPAAGWLQVPYLAWVTFATVLNAALWRLN